MSSLHAAAEGPAGQREPARPIDEQLRDLARDRARTATGRPLQPRTPGASSVVLSQAMELRHASVAGNVHGGEIMRLIDTAAGIAASRHAGGPAVTVALDEMSFLHPVRVGDIVFVQARVNDAGQTSVEVGVRVETEDVPTGVRTHTSSAYLVFVALDEHGRPRPVAPIEAETAEDRRRQAEARIRRASRLARAEAIRRQRREP